MKKKQLIKLMIVPVGIVLTGGCVAALATACQPKPTPPPPKRKDIDISNLIKGDAGTCTNINQSIIKFNFMDTLQYQWKMSAADDSFPMLAYFDSNFVLRHTNNSPMQGFTPGQKFEFDSS
jgi:hypothetical protein